MLECAGWAHSSAILKLKNDVDTLGLQQKVREEQETVRCLRQRPAGTSRAQGMVRKKSAHVKNRGWDRVGANQKLNILCDVQHLLDVQVEGVERVEHGTCGNLHCRRAAAVSVVRAGSIIPDWESRSRRGHEQQRQRRGPPSRKAHTSDQRAFEGVPLTMCTTDRIVHTMVCVS